MFQLFQTARNKKGFTLIETIVAIMVFVIVVTISMELFTNSLASSRRTEVSRMLYEESRIALERIVKEVRQGTIDYEEYYNWNVDPNPNYGGSYGAYAALFYDNGVNTGQATDAALATEVQDELYLITADGSEKTIIKIEADGTENRLKMLKMLGRDYGTDGLEGNILDGEGDGIMDTWVAIDDFVGPVFQQIQPSSIQITDLQFIINPLEDPRKSFADFDGAVQIQPYVTIVMTARPAGAEDVDPPPAGSGDWKMPGIKGQAPSITLQTTVSARAQNEVKSHQ